MYGVLELPRPSNIVPSGISYNLGSGFLAGHNRYLVGRSFRHLWCGGFRVQGFEQITATWWPRFSPCISSALTIFEQYTADAWERFRIPLQRRRPRSNVSAIDRLGLHWLRENHYGVVKDDKGTALIPVMSSYLHGLKQQACSNTVQFEPAVGPMHSREVVFDFASALNCSFHLLLHYP